MKKRTKKESNKKTIITLVIVLFTLLILIGISSFFVYKEYKNYYKYTFKLTTKEITVKVNENVNPEDYIKEYKNVKIKYINIVTSTIGEKELTYYVIDRFKIGHYYYIKVNVIDDEAPVITAKDKITIYTGSKIDLNSYIKVTDNYDKDVDIKIDGNVDTSKEGTYKVTYTATDKSGNSLSHIITFTVKKKEVYVAPPVENGTQGVTSKGYKIVNKGGATYIGGILIANKTYNLSSTYGSGLTSATNSAFKEMNKAATEAGYPLRIGSGYRSYKTQNTIYNNYVKRDGKTKADTYSARPGHSEHQTGLAIDICNKDKKIPCINSGFNNTDTAKWLSDNAYKYGFILRYPSGKTNETGYKFESWHYRYVGKDIASKLYNNGNWITLESYLGITSKYSE
ncbi:MAG: D-alanyl-D-alanine carboxypeptidase family protein [Bacilli bacterium]|nr:D-alanyl-D-alanine carboxypeptidase family protein [Bacilli bacterium]